MVEGIFSSENYVMAKRLLDAAALRHEALTANLANIETPGYKRVDIAPEFAAQLDAAAGRNDVAALKNLSPKLAEDRLTASVRPDGNNVSLDRELIEVNRNSTEYEFLTQFLSSNIRRLESAIRTNVQ
jgi:flagellar basal-body rod protein FlgB